jgi:hypothetical protein
MSSINLADLIPLLEQRLGIREGFFESLDADEESDWSFLIKVHALIEAAVSHLIVERLGDERLNDIASWLELSNKRTGKAAFIKSLQLLGKPEQRFISSLSEIRNTLVHDIKNVDFSLERHVAQLDAQKFKLFVQNFNLLSSKVDDETNRLFKLDPRQALWYSSMALLGLVYLQLPELPRASHL